MKLAQLVSYVVRLAQYAAWAPLGVLFLHEVLAASFGHEPYVDPTMHVLGGAAIAFFLRYAGGIADRWLGAPSDAALDLLAFGLTCAVAVAWELGEYFADQYLDAGVQRGLGNTMRDLAMGASGSIAYLLARRLIVWFYGRSAARAESVTSAP